MTIRKAEDFGRWYSELVVKSEMIDYSDISGALLQPAHPSMHAVMAQPLSGPDWMRQFVPKVRSGIARQLRHAALVLAQSDFM